MPGSRAISPRGRRRSARLGPVRQVLFGIGRGGIDQLVISTGRETVIDSRRTRQIDAIDAQRPDRGGAPRAVRFVGMPAVANVSFRAHELRISSQIPRWVRSVRGRTDVAPRRVDVVANLAHRLAFRSHGHHGTRDVEADPSAIAHRIEQHRAVVPDLLHVAARVRGVPPLPAPAEAGHPLQEILVGDREAVILLDPRRGFVELLRPAIFGRPR